MSKAIFPFSGSDIIPLAGFEAVDIPSEEKWKFRFKKNLSPTNLLDSWFCFFTIEERLGLSTNVDEKGRSTEKTTSL